MYTFPLNGPFFFVSLYVFIFLIWKLDIWIQWFRNWKADSPILQGLLFAAVLVYCFIFLIAAVCLCAEEQPDV